MQPPRARPAVRRRTRAHSARSHNKYVARPGPARAPDCAIRPTHQTTEAPTSPHSPRLAGARTRSDSSQTSADFARAAAEQPASHERTAATPQPRFDQAGANGAPYSLVGGAARRGHDPAPPRRQHAQPSSQKRVSTHAASRAQAAVETCASHCLPRASMGGSTGIRTLDQWIKNPLLYRLSYRPARVLGPVRGRRTSAKRSACPLFLATIGSTNPRASRRQSEVGISPVA
jgi:hypothetical protein